MGRGLVVGLVGLLGWSVACASLDSLSGHGVKVGANMEAYAVAYLEEHDVLEEGERILAYYDATMALSGEDAAILTDRRVMYHKAGRTTSIPLSEVEDVQHRYEPILGDIIDVRGADGTLLHMGDPLDINDIKILASATLFENGLSDMPYAVWVGDPENEPIN